VITYLAILGLQVFILTGYSSFLSYIHIFIPPFYCHSQGQGLSIHGQGNELLAEAVNGPYMLS
jgi:hypothetical protein